jgi:hypothetical protein
LDVEALLNFSQHVLLNAARLWIEASVDQKQRLRKAIFPGGLSFSEGTFGTAQTSLVFQLIEAPITEKADMVSPTGLEAICQGLNSSWCIPFQGFVEAA